MAEYKRLLPFGYGVATSFIPLLHEPLKDIYGEFLSDEISLEDRVAEYMLKGGEVVDMELAAQVQDMIDLKM